MVPLNDYKILPYDMYCLSIKSAVKERVCNLCGYLFSKYCSCKTTQSREGLWRSRIWWWRRKQWWRQLWRGRRQKRWHGSRACGWRKRMRCTQCFWTSPKPYIRRGWLRMNHYHSIWIIVDLSLTMIIIHLIFL